MLVLKATELCRIFSTRMMVLRFTKLQNRPVFYRREIQPQFPEEQVLFVASYFMHFVKRYRIAFALPRFLGVPYEKWLDHRVCGKHVPYMFYVKLHDGFVKVRNALKDFLVHHLPKVYMKLRMLKHRKRAKKVD